MEVNRWRLGASRFSQEGGWSVRSVWEVTQGATLSRSAIHFSGSGTFWILDHPWRYGIANCSILP
jgi:hypothetical protein